MDTLNPLDIARLRGCACGAADMADAITAMQERPLPKWAKQMLETFRTRLNYQYEVITKAADKLEGK